MIFTCLVACAQYKNDVQLIAHCTPHALGEHFHHFNGVLLIQLQNEILLLFKPTYTFSCSNQFWTLINRSYNNCYKILRWDHFFFFFIFYHDEIIIIYFHTNIEYDYVCTKIYFFNATTTRPYGFVLIIYRHTSHCHKLNVISKIYDKLHKLTVDK